MLRLPLAVDLLHNEGRVPLDHNLPCTVLARQAQAEYQGVVLSEVVGSSVETLDPLVFGAVAQLDNACSRDRAGTLAAAVEVDGRLVHLGSILSHGLSRRLLGAPSGGGGRAINALSMQGDISLQGRRILGCPSVPWPHPG